jgi:RHS repeat-associated protein
MYDEVGHLVGEYTGSSGTPVVVQETVWLGDIPVATLRGTLAYYVHTDQLNTPRRITQPNGANANKLRWSWDPSPFGDGALANDNPAALGSFKYNLRFPGQYFDSEANLYYNYFRDYDPAVGRYVESDPSGLLGGINTFAYVGSDPLSDSDPTGLAPPRSHPNSPGVGIPPLIQPGPFDDSWNQSVKNTTLAIEEWIDNAVNTVRGWCSSEEDDGPLLAEQETLTAEEEAALRAKAAGQPYDQAAYNRARQKQIKNEKYNKERNKRKRRG